MPATPLDQWIGFQPWSLGIYVSLWLYIVCAPRVMADRHELTAYFATASTMAFVGLVLFIIVPTQTPDQGIDFAGHPGFALLRGADQGHNACPSLHAAFSVLTALWLDRIIVTCRGPQLIRVANALWGSAIVYATVATNQHVAIDAAAGSLLGASAFLIERWITREYRQRSGNQSPVETDRGMARAHVED